MWHRLALFAVVGLLSCDGPFQHCASDQDCSSHLVCQTCDGVCTYGPYAPCNMKAPCPCDYSCRSGQCQPNSTGQANPVSCIRDRECAIDQFCNSATSTCQNPMYVTGGSNASCATNADCPSGQICSTANGPPECGINQSFVCHTNSDCQEGCDCDSGQCRKHTC